MSVDSKSKSLFDAIQAGDYRQVQLLVRAGAAVNSVNDSGQTPLALAHQGGHGEIVTLLISAGAKLQVAGTPDEQPASDTAIGNRPFQVVYTPPGSASLGNVAGRTSATNPEATYTVDIEDLFGAQDRSIRSTASAPSGNWDEGETYAIDLENFDAGAGIGKPTAPSGNWDEGETYAIDLDTLATAMIGNKPNPPSGNWDGNETETYAIDLDTLTTTMTGGKPTAPSGNWDEGETYAIDLENFDAGASIGKSAAPSGNWDEGETYAIDLENFDAGASIGKSEAPSGNLGEGETYSVDLDRSDMLGERSSDALQNWETAQSYAIDLDLDAVVGSAEDSAPLPIASEWESDTFVDRNSQAKSRSGGESSDGEDGLDFNTETVTITGFTNPQQKAANFDEDATNSSLMAAIIAGECELAERAILDKANLNRYDWDLTYSPLGMAIERGHTEIVRTLLNFNADPRCGSLEMNSLGLAAVSGDDEIIQLLLDAGVDPNSVVDAKGWTAIAHAIDREHFSAIELLIAAGASVNITAEEMTCIALAAATGNRRIYHLIYERSSEPLRRWADRDGEWICRAIELEGERKQNRPIEKLIALAMAGNVGEITKAITLGVEVDTFGSGGYTALMAAAYYGHIEVVQQLLDAGASPNLTSESQCLWGREMTPLMLAAGSFFALDRHKIVNVLVRAGADVNYQNSRRDSALSLAVLTGSGYQDCTIALLHAGANPNLPDRDGNSLMTILAANGNQPMLSLLLQGGANPSGIAAIQLIQAVRNGDIQRTKTLLAAGANPSADRSAALQAAVVAGFTEIANLLIVAGANVNAVDLSGFTPLATAAYEGDLEIFNLLLAAGANPHWQSTTSRWFNNLYACTQAGLELDDRSPNPDEPTLDRDRQHARIIAALAQLGIKG